MDATQSLEYAVAAYENHIAQRMSGDVTEQAMRAVRHWKQISQNYT